MTGPTEIVLRFQPLRAAVLWPQRVRRLLKYALRACDLRCVRVDGLPADESAREEGNHATPAS